MGGFLRGVLAGMLVWGLVLVALSLSNPLPPRPGAEAPQLEVTASGDGAEAEAAPEAEAGTDASQGSTEGDAPAAADEGAETQSGAGTPADGASGDETPAPETAAPDADAAPAEEGEESGNAGPAMDIPLPSGSEFNRPPPEQAAAVPAPDAELNAAAPTAPRIAAETQSPQFDTSPAARPAVSADAPATIVVVPVLRDVPLETSSRADPAFGSTVPAPLTQPAGSDNPLIETASAPLPAAAPTETVVDEPAENTTSSAIPERQTPGADIAAMEATEPETPTLATPRFPVIASEGAPEVPAQAPGDIAAPRLPQVTRLPQAGGDGLPRPSMPGTASEEVVAAPEVAEQPDGGGEDLPAIEAFAAPFDPEEARPLLAVVLIDDPDGAVDMAALTRLSFPVTFAVDALHPDAAERAQAFRAAGFEVVMLGSMMADGATAADAEVALAGALSVLPETVALIDTPDHRIQGDRELLDATVEALAQTGHGLLAFPRGLNAAEQTAARVGVPGMTLFRLLDDEDQRAPTITRFLSRAAFAAAQEGAVVVAGHARPDTVTALVSWALGDRSEGVALAPVSAVLLREAAQ